MNPESIQAMQRQFDVLAQRLPDDRGIEFWFARDLQEPLGYARWENFLTAIQRAIESCETTGYSAPDHFRGVTKLMTHGKGDAALFGGHSTQAMKAKFGITQARPLADYLPTLTSAAKNLSTEMTSHNVQRADLLGESAITREHVQNNSSVRDVLGRHGVAHGRDAACAGIEVDI